MSRVKFRKTKRINWKFNDKHRAYIRRAKDSRLNVAEGAVRAGKTIDNIVAFANELDRHPDKIHLATGSTVGNAKLNIGEANGFGLEYMFRGRCKWGKFKSNECLYVNTGMGEKVVIFAGGDKSNSWKRIRGNSYGMWIATEINVHHNSMIMESFDRLRMSSKEKVFWDLNPSNPKHFIYVDYIDKYAEMEEKGEFSGGYNYEHFTIFDNASLTEEQIANTLSTYDPETVHYRRSILGERAVADGLIYKKFADNPQDYFIKSTEVPKLKQVSIGVDFGQGVKSYTAFVAVGISYNNDVYILASKKFAGEITEDIIGDRYVKFLQDVEAIYNVRVSYTYGDSARTMAITSLKNSLAKANLSRLVWPSKKLRINERIDGVSVLINQGRLFYTELAEEAKEALETSVWDSREGREDQRLDEDTDVIDAFEYGLERDLPTLLSLKI